MFPVILLLLLSLAAAFLLFYLVFKGEEKEKKKREFDQLVKDNNLSRIQVPLLMNINKFIENFEENPVLDKDEIESFVWKVESLSSDLVREGKEPPHFLREVLIRVYDGLMRVEGNEDENCKRYAADFAKKHNL